MLRMSFTMMRNWKLTPDALFQLTALEAPSSSEAEAIELLTLLVERYEREHYPIPAADPAEIVRFLIEQQNLTQRDLIPQFGSESAVSMFLAGQRKLTLAQVRKLSMRFKLPADVLSKKNNGLAGADAARLRKQYMNGYCSPVRSLDGPRF